MDVEYIRNAKIVTEGGITDGALAIEEGVIAAIGRNSLAPSRGANVLDVEGRWLIPGVVDPEMHLGSNRALDEDFASETRAAAASGVTTANLQQTTHTIFSSQESRPAPDRELLFSDLVSHFTDIGSSRSWIDFALTPLLMTERQVDEIPELAGEWGIPTYKLYLHMKLGREHLSSAWPQAPLLGVSSFDDALVYATMNEVAKLGERGLLSLHCENWEIARVREQSLRAEGRTDTAAWAERSPGYLEAMHVAAYGLLATELGCRVHVQHVSALETLPVLHWLRSRSPSVFGQTGVHYLVLDESSWKLNTPIRGRPHSDELWKALASGLIDAVGSDHVNRSLSRDQMEKGNVWEDISGFPSRAEAHLPVMLSEGYNEGRLTMDRLVQVMATNPAKLWGLYPKKGIIAVGSDADLVVVDSNEEYVVTDEEVLSSCGWSLYSGMSLKGRPMVTILRGQVLAEVQAGRYEFADRAQGQFIVR